LRLKFLHFSLDEQRVYFEQGAQRQGVSPVILEKDFWVCWLLGVLFESKFKDDLVFKGGTSLSKVFRVIGRFSEDIDLSLSPTFLNLAPPDIDNLSRNQAGQWMKRAEIACAKAVQEQLQPELEQLALATLGATTHPWFSFQVDERTHSPVLQFRYPTTQSSGFSYLPRSVKLEFGSLTDQQPTGTHPIVPWLAEVIPQALDDWRCEVMVLDLERTFWEKATILHVEHYRPNPSPDRFSRHYADTATLAMHEVASKAINNEFLRNRVVAWKNLFFGSAWARYDLAVPGSFKLLPPPGRIPAIRQDYQAMRDMYIEPPKNFDHILDALRELEARINGGA
jgi:Nucleotidyl transferase AbiEii toxin, Type IV TA system